MAKLSKSNTSLVEMVLRVAVAGEFLGHGMFALSGKEQWVNWVQQLSGLDTVTAAQFMMLVGLLDLIVAVIIFVRPIRAVLLWAIFWGFWTAILRPIVGEPIWDFVERWANWGAPLALLLLLGLPKKIEDLWK